MGRAKDAIPRQCFQAFFMSGHTDIYSAHWCKQTRWLKSAGNQPGSSGHSNNSRDLFHADRKAQPYEINTFSQLGEN